MAYSTYSSGTRGLLRLAAFWGVMAVGTATGIAHFDEIRSALGLKFEFDDIAGPSPSSRPVSKTRGDRSVVLQASPSGHFEARAQVNGRSIRVMVDTGATLVALTHEDAAAAGIHPNRSDYRHSVSTANGTARVASVMLDEVAIDDVVVRGVRAVVAEPGRLGVSLLGMSFLGQLSRTEISRGKLTLQD